MEPVDLLHNRHILPAKAVPAPKPKLHAELWNSVNCSPDIFRSTLTKIPETESILKKSRLPLGILIHPFKDLSHLPVIQCQTIVRYDMLRQKLSEVLYLMNHFVFADVGSAAPTSILSYNSSIKGAGDATFVTGSTTVSTRLHLFFHNPTHNRCQSSARGVSLRSGVQILRGPESAAGVQGDHSQSSLSSGQ